MRSLAKKMLLPFVQRHIRSWLYSSAHRSFPRRQIQRKHGDFAPLVELVDQKGAQWYDRDRDFEPEIHLLRQHRLVPGARVFDLGAHQGVVAIALAHIVGETGGVVAVEAMPFDAQAAEQNRMLNGLTQLTVVHAAVAAQSGEVDFVNSGRAAYGEATQPTIQVRCITVDELADEYGTPDILFVDVDGFEVEALRGAQRVLATRPDCYLEVHSELLPRYGHRARDVLEFFPDQHYDLLVSHQMKESLRQVARLNRTQHDFTRGFHMLAIAKQ